MRAPEKASHHIGVSGQALDGHGICRLRSQQGLDEPVIHE
jgi:hypothetical protein